MGLASSLIFRCSCGHLASVRADLKLVGSAAKVAEVDVGKPFLNKTNASDFEINNRFLLGLQRQSILQHHQEQEGENPFGVGTSKCGLKEILQAPF
jgi:hypothetical protein